MNVKLKLVSMSLGVIRQLKRPLSPIINYQPSGRQLCDFPGFKLMLDFSWPWHRAIYKQGYFESDITDLLPRMVRAGEAYVDIGANLGWHTISMLSKRPDLSMAFAFEPSRQMCALLEESLIANGYQHRCRVERLALSDKREKKNLKTFTELDPMHASLYPLADCAYKEEEVEVDTLDSRAERFDMPIGVIKCDVEGAERDVLMGAKGVLGGKFGPPPIWFIEANYETSGMAGFFPWQLIEVASAHAPYRGYHIRDKRITQLPGPTALRHGDTLILAIPELHRNRLDQARL